MSEKIPEIALYICPENGKRQMWTRKRKFCGYSLFGDSWIRYNAHLPSNKNDDSVRCCNICNICNIFSGDKSSNKIGIFHFWFTKLWKYFLCLFDHKSRCFCCFTIFAKKSYSLHIWQNYFQSGRWPNSVLSTSISSLLIGVICSIMERDLCPSNFSLK